MMDVGIEQVVRCPVHDYLYVVFSRWAGDPLACPKCRAAARMPYDKTGAGSAGHGYGSTPGQIGRLKARP